MTLNLYFGGSGWGGRLRGARVSWGWTGWVGGAGESVSVGGGEGGDGAGEKFATYYRDGTGVDYADQRYYSSIMGRFLTPDPAKSSDPVNPQTWNQYVYAENDPISLNDPTGEFASIL